MVKPAKAASLIAKQLVEASKTNSNQDEYYVVRLGKPALTIHYHRRFLVGINTKSLAVSDRSDVLEESDTKPTALRECDYATIKPVQFHLIDELHSTRHLEAKKLGG
jgi:hypothetical protein